MSKFNVQIVVISILQERSTVPVLPHFLIPRGTLICGYLAEDP